MRGAIFLLLSTIFTGCHIYNDTVVIRGFLFSGLFKKEVNPALISYEGYAFDALINGVPVIEINNKDKIASLKEYIDKTSVHWQLLKPLPANTPIVVDIKRKRIKEHDIGKLNPKSYEIDYHPLFDVKLDREMVLVKNPNIIINGKTLITRRYIIKQLPKGDYVVSLTVVGSKNWDRKEIFVQVREEDNVSKFF